MRTVAGIVLLSLLAAGCSTGSGSLFGSGSSSGGQSSPDFTDRIASFFSTGGSSRPQQQAGDPTIPEDVDCPGVSVREGASTLAVHGAGEPSALNLRYQGTIGRLARECKVVGRTMQMKVGMEGRIILGPAGGPGKVDVPLRFAVVKEGPQAVTILTKTYRVPVTIDAGASNVPFAEIDEAITFPMPSLSDLDAYVVYVGYDPEALKKPAPRPRKKTAPRQRNAQPRQAPAR
jgi:hypothetical protein